MYDICLTEVSSYFSSKIGALECFEEIFELKELDEVCFGLIFADFLNAEVDLKYVNEPSCEARFLDTAFLEADLSKSETKKIRELEKKKNNAFFLFGKHSETFQDFLTLRFYVKSFLNLESLKDLKLPFLQF